MNSFDFLDTTMESTTNDEEDEPIFQRMNTNNMKYNDTEMSLTQGQMTPISEEVSDTASNYSNNSRNFQMPEKDFIMEINK